LYRLTEKGSKWLDSYDADEFVGYSLERLIKAFLLRGVYRTGSGLEAVLDEAGICEGSERPMCLGRALRVLKELEKEGLIESV